MKLLFDENLSPRLVHLLQDAFPGSAHVHEAGLERASDADIWRYARKSDYVITTKDADFLDLSMMLGPPPKFVWLRRGNCSTGQIAGILRANHPSIAALIEDQVARYLILE